MLLSELRDAIVRFTRTKQSRGRCDRDRGYFKLHAPFIARLKWLKKLGSSGDPAAACSTQVSELHNAYINPAVAGHNLRVAGRRGIKPLAEYCLALSSE
ncbi:hypothetical protein KGM_212910 [Danaus plexippus plexippus]|uniref:Uncharacterized protein n=1 Tax=Danaus plexippus plexippus TaxID=278856 RepID=A0A212EKL7_DANPL|nr:hypothetical protein KGM_212910 [Danaus plexippus plexippus]